MISENNGSTLIFIEKLGNKFLPGQFWPCLYFASLSVPSGLALSSDFLSCGPNLYCCDMKLRGDMPGKYSFYGIHQLLSQLRVMHFNPKIIS